MSKNGKKSVWEKTDTQHLIRNKESGIYYGRFTLRGKQKWVSLKTTVHSVAKTRVRAKADEIDEARANANPIADADTTMDRLIECYAASVETDPDISEATKETKRTGIKNLRKTWPGLLRMKPHKVRIADIQDWVKRYKEIGTGFIPPGSKTVRKGNSHTSVRRAIAALRSTFQVAVEQGFIFRNPVPIALPRKRRGIRTTEPRKRLVLPSDRDVRRVIAEIRKNGAVGGWNHEAADFCRFMLFTGARVGEAARVVWDDVDFKRRRIHLPGTKSLNSDRTIPMMSDLYALLLQLKARRKAAARFRSDGSDGMAADDTLFHITGCQESITKACARAGVKRFTHHAFRHLFATKCIEAGVDTLTISHWLGHSDGGVLVQKTYGHLRPSHSDAQAKKVKFAV